MYFFNFQQKETLMSNQDFAKLSAVVRGEDLQGKGARPPPT